jgi:hypothetical protein
VAGIAAIAILALLTSGVIALKNNEKSVASAVPTTTTTTFATTATADVSPQTAIASPAAEPAPAPNMVYKNGSYSASGSYTSPDGTERLSVTITIADDVVADASATPGARDRTSAQYQQLFVNNFKPLVVGKNIDSVVLSRVSGSSLTSRGFNSALEQIKQQAKT